MKRSNILPPIEPESSRDYYGLYQSRDFYKGTSFKMKGIWDPGTHYFNDEYIIDYVAYEGALLACKRSHLAEHSNRPILVYNQDGVIIGIESSPYWTFVLSGVKGDAGEKVLFERIFEDGNDKIIWGYEHLPKDKWQTLCSLEELKGDSVKEAELLADGSLEFTLLSNKKVVTQNNVLPNFVVGNVTSTSFDAPAKVTLNKSSQTNTWSIDFSIPSGRATTVEVDPVVESLPSSSSPYVSNLSSDIAKILLKFGIPKGEKGEKGDKGQDGDQNIYVGCTPPEDKSMIWYDPCENAINGVSSDQIVYEAYVHAGGNATKESFEQALSKITTFGSGSGNPSSVDLSNYYDKKEVDDKISALETMIKDLTNIIWTKA